MLSSLNTEVGDSSVNTLKRNGKYNVPSASAVSKSSFCVYAFRMILTVNSCYFLKAR
jgi:hypothetical protein